MPKRFCIGCNQLYDRDATGTYRCPRCQPAATRRANTRANTTARGYGYEHQQLRQQLLDAFQPGQLCARCGKPILTKNDADLGHSDGQRTYSGLEHRLCNRGAPGRKRR